MIDEDKSTLAFEAGAAEVEDQQKVVAISRVKEILMNGDDNLTLLSELPLTDNLRPITSAVAQSIAEKVTVETLTNQNDVADFDFMLNEILNLSSNKSPISSAKNSTPVNQTWLDRCINCFRLSPIIKQIDDEKISFIASKFFNDNFDEFSCWLNDNQETNEGYHQSDFFDDEVSPPENHKTKTSKKIYAKDSTKFVSNLDSTYVEESSEQSSKAELPLYCEKCARIIAEDVLKCSGCRSCYHGTCCTESNLSETTEENGQKSANRWRCERCNRFTVYASKAKIPTIPTSSTPRVLLASSDRKQSKSSDTEGKRSKNLDSNEESRNNDKISPNLLLELTHCVACRQRKIDYTKSVYCSNACMEIVVSKIKNMLNYDMDERVSIFDYGNPIKVSSHQTAPKLKNLFPYLSTHPRCYPCILSPDIAATIREKRKILSKENEKAKKFCFVRGEKRPSKSLIKIENEQNLPSTSSGLPTKDKNYRIEAVKKAKKLNNLNKDASKNGPKLKKISQNQQQQQVVGGPKVDQVRMSVRQLLRNCLFDRMTHCDDILLSKAELNPIAIEIEREMFKAYKGEVQGASYKQQFKALLVNLKEQRNQGFFRRILNGTLTPFKVATMSGQEMASKKNSFWPTANNANSAVKVDAHASSSSTLNDADLAAKQAYSTSNVSNQQKAELSSGNVNNNNDQQPFVSSQTSLVNEEQSSQSNESQKLVQIDIIVCDDKVGPSSTTNSDSIISPTGRKSSTGVAEKTLKIGAKRRSEDTTSQHKSHLFDLSCKICTGKITAYQYFQMTVAKRQKSENQIAQQRPVNSSPPPTSSSTAPDLPIPSQFLPSVSRERHDEESVWKNQIQSSPTPSPTENEPMLYARPSTGGEFRPMSANTMVPAPTPGRPVLLSPPTLLFAPVENQGVPVVAAIIQPSEPFLSSGPSTNGGKLAIGMPHIQDTPSSTHAPALRNVPYIGAPPRVLPPVARIPPVQNNLDSGQGKHLDPRLKGHRLSNDYDVTSDSSLLPRYDPVGSKVVDPRLLIDFESSSSMATSMSQMPRPASEMGSWRPPPAFDLNISPPPRPQSLAGANNNFISLPPPPKPPQLPQPFKTPFDSNGSLAYSNSPKTTPSVSVEPSPPLVEEYVWRGLLDMPGYYRFNAAFVGVSGPFELLSRDLPSHLKIVGRIPIETVYDYVRDLKGDVAKDVVVVRLAEPPDLQQKAQYHGLLGNMVLKGKLSVVETSKLPKVKDLYFLPLQRNEQPNPVLLPFDGPGLPNPRHDLIMAIVVRRKDKIELEKPDGQG